MITDETRSLSIMAMMERNKLREPFKDHMMKDKYRYEDYDEDTGTVSNTFCSFNTCM